MPRYELGEGASNKFWEVTLSSSALATSWGKIGGSTSSRSREFANAAAAREAHDRLVAEKLRSGYRLVGGKPRAAKSGAAKPVVAQPVGPASNPDLERAIIDDPDAADGYLVYADWLQGQGDPRGELGVLQHQMLVGKDAAKRAAGIAAKALLKRHATHFLGEFATQKPETFELRWHCGFIRSAKLGWPPFVDAMDSADADDDDVYAVDWGKRCRTQLAAFLRLPSARFIQELALGPVPGEEEMNLDDLAKAIDDVVPPCLRALEFGNLGNWDISSTTAAMPASRSIQGLHTLVLHAGSLAIGAIDLPELRRAAFQTGGLTKSRLKKLTSARWPKLERLEIWFGEPRYGADCTIKSIAPILDAEGLANVRHLGLMNCAFADEIAKALPRSKILRQLETLDLSMGNLSDRGVALMAGSKDAFQHLARLDVSDNALTDAAKPLLKGLAKQLEFGKRHTIERALPRSEDFQYYRYVSVGE